MSQERELENTYPEIDKLIRDIYENKGPIKPSDINKEFKGQNSESIEKIFSKLTSLAEIEDFQVEMAEYDQENDLSRFIALKIPEFNDKRFEIEIFISTLAPYAAISVYGDMKEASPQWKNLYVFRELNIITELARNEIMKNLYHEVRDILSENNIEILPWTILDLKIKGAQLAITSELRSEVFDLIFGEPALFW